MKYNDKLKDKQWKVKRLSILIRDKHTCQLCGYIGKRVHVHHKSYNGNPWDVDDSELITLCSSCHKKVHNTAINDRIMESTRIGRIMALNHG